MVKKRKRLESPRFAGDAIYELLQRLGGSPERAKLAGLWQNWASAMGDELAEIAIPLGSKGDVLLIMAQDAMQMQELHFQAEEVVERANAYLGCAYFRTARINLCETGASDFEIAQSQSQTALVEKTPAEQGQAIPKRQKLPAPSGKFLSEMDPNSPVARCYAKFAGKKFQ